MLIVHSFVQFMYFDRQDADVNHNFEQKNQSYCLFGEDHDPSAWPSRTNILCWHCCHAFDAIPVSFPTRIIKKADGMQWVMRGVFCSVNCCKRFVGDSMVFNSPSRLMWINMFARVVLGMKRPETIRPAPAREFLAVFGGSMSIEEFRASFDQAKQAVTLSYPFLSHSMMSRNADVQKTTESIEQTSVRCLTRPKDKKSPPKKVAVEEPPVPETPDAVSGVAAKEEDAACFDRFIEERKKTHTPSSTPQSGPNKPPPFLILQSDTAEAPKPPRPRPKKKVPKPKKKKTKQKQAAPKKKPAKKQTKKKSKPKSVKPSPKPSEAIKQKPPAAPKNTLIQYMITY